MQSEYVADVVGSPRSANEVDCPLMNFHSSLLALGSPLLVFSSSIAFCAVRQPLCAVDGHGVSKHIAVDSSQVCDAEQGSVPGLQVPDWQVSAPLQNTPSE